MQLGLMLGYSGARIHLPIDLILEAERLGYYAVWTSEAYGSDCITPLAWIGALTTDIKLGAAIMQMPARSPAMTAMTAITLDQLSGGRMLLGLGLSGPQVVEGWHGAAYGKPLAKTREYVRIVRQILQRDAPLVHDGEHYQIPYRGADASGLGKPLKSIIHGRADMPIYLAAIGPRNVALTAEIADGWLPMNFSPAHYEEVYAAAVAAGFALAADKSQDNFDIAPSVSVILSDDLPAAYNQIKPRLRSTSAGWARAARISILTWLAAMDSKLTRRTSRRCTCKDAGAKPSSGCRDDLVDAVALVGGKARIRDRLQIWRDCPITSMNVMVNSPSALRFLAEELL